MYDHNISGMVDALKEAGVLTERSSDTAYKTLQEYWYDKISLTWIVEDVISAANDIGLTKTPESYRVILKRVLDRHDAEYGVSWETIRSAIIEARDLP